MAVPPPASTLGAPARRQRTVSSSGRPRKAEDAVPCRGSCSPGMCCWGDLTGWLACGSARAPRLLGCWAAKPLRLGCEGCPAASRTY